MSMGDLANGRRAVSSALLAWVMLALFGCGAGLQADDAQTAAIVTRARELYDAGDFAAARDKAELAVGRSPESAAALYLRGLARLRLEDFAGAKSDLGAARQLDPLFLFTPDRAEFEAAWEEVRAELPDAPVPVDTPAAGAAPAGLEQPRELPTPAQPSTGAAAQPPVDAGPEVELLQQPGNVIRDFSGAGLLGDAETAAIERETAVLGTYGLELKFLTVESGRDLGAQAASWHRMAGLRPRTLLVLGDADGEVAAYSPLMTEEDIATAAADAKALEGASTARRMIYLALALSKRMRFVPGEVPSASSPEFPPPPGFEQPKPPERPKPVSALWYLAGGLLVVAAALVVGTRVGRARRVTRTFGVARPQIDAVASTLAELAGRLSRHPHRAAQRELEAAELAYFEALDMLRAADAGKAGDLGRVERAVRLLSEAAAKVDRAAQQAAESTAEADGPFAWCYFTGRPLFERWDGDLVKLRHDGQERLVMASRQLEGVLRRGERPAVRTVGGRHWAVVEEFEPLTDFYSLRHGDETTAPGQLAEPLPAAPRWPLYLDLDDRPDYTLDLDGDG